MTGYSLSQQRARRLVAVALALVASSGAALAQSSALDRFEALSERMTELTYQGLAEQAPVLDGLLPSAEWDRPMRRAGRCALNAYQAQVGRDGISQMLDAMEAALASATPADVLAGNIDAGTPEGLTAADVNRINNECGMIELQLQRLAESGAMQALQNQ